MVETADVLFDGYEPDLSYLPHPDYVAMTAQLTGDARFARRYEGVPREELGTLLGIALRRDSAHFDAMRAIVSLGPAR